MFNLKLHAHFELHLVLYLYLLSGIKGGFKSYASREDTVFEGKGPSRQLDLIDPTPAPLLSWDISLKLTEGRGAAGRGPATQGPHCVLAVEVGVSRSLCRERKAQTG